MMTIPRRYFPSFVAAWWLALVLAAVLAATGCTPRDLGKPDTVRAAVAIAEAWAIAGPTGSSVTPAPGPDTNNGQCWNCNGRGQVGDGVTMLTCQVCGGSGKAAITGLSEASRKMLAETIKEQRQVQEDLASMNKPAGPHDATVGKDAPAEEPSDGSSGDASAAATETGAAEAPEPFSWEEARELSKETGRPVIAVLHYADEANHRACKPCLTLEKWLGDPAFFAKLEELGIVATGTVERWKHKQAPTLIYAKSGADKTVYFATGRSTDNPRGFRLRDQGTFLLDLKEWINAIEK